MVYKTTCPICGKKGRSVDNATLKSMLAVSLRLVQDSLYRFCASPDCDVVYYSESSTQTFTTRQVRERVYQKEVGSEDVLICYCFQHTTLDVRQHVVAGLEAAHAFADRLDHTNRLGAAQRRQLGLVAIGAADGPEVVIVDRRQDGPDAYLTGTGLRDGAVRHDQDVGRFAKRGVNVAAHDVSLHSGDVQAHIDVITCRIGIGADLMRGVHQPLGIGAVDAVR